MRSSDSKGGLIALTRAMVARVDGRGMLMRFDGCDHADRKVDY